MKAKLLYLLLLSLVGVVCRAQQQVPISQLPTQSTPPPSGWLPYTDPRDNITRKVDVKTLPKLDSFYSNKDTLWGMKAGRKFFALLSSGSINNAYLDSLIDSKVQPETFPDVLHNGNTLNQGEAVNLVNNAMAFTIQTAGSGSSTQVGALIQPQSASLNIAPLLDVHLLRTNINFNASSGLQYKNWSNAGYSVFIDINNHPNNGTWDFPTTGAQLNKFKVSLDSLATIIENNGYKVVEMAIENEYGNDTYRNSPYTHALDYINELSAAIQILHSHGIKVTDGGGQSAEYMWIVWKWLVDQGRLANADSFRIRELGGANVSGWATNPAHQEKIAFFQTILAAQDTMDLDHSNFHYYADDTVYAEDLQWIVEAIHDITGKPVITNEIGQYTTNANHAKQIVAALEDKVPYLLYYSENNTDPNKAKALHNTDNTSLNSTGVNFSGYVQNLVLSDTTIKKIFVLNDAGNGKVKIPYMAGATGTAFDDEGNMIPGSGGNGGSYTLPVASASVLGGIRVGAGLDIDGNGILSVIGNSDTSDTEDDCELSFQDVTDIDSITTHSIGIGENLYFSGTDNGIRYDVATGNMQYKNNGGTWTDIGSGSGGSQDLQSVTTINNVTTNDIVIKYYNDAGYRIKDPSEENYLASLDSHDGDGGYLTLWDHDANLAAEFGQESFITGNGVVKLYRLGVLNLKIGGTYNFHNTDASKFLTTDADGNMILATVTTGIGAESDPNAILNQTTLQSGANFNISGAGKVGSLTFNTLPSSGSYKTDSLLTVSSAGVVNRVKPLWYKGTVSTIATSTPSFVQLTSTTDSLLVGGTNTAMFAKNNFYGTSNFFSGLSAGGTGVISGTVLSVQGKSTFQEVMLASGSNTSWIPFHNASSGQTHNTIDVSSQQSIDGTGTTYSGTVNSFYGHPRSSSNGVGKFNVFTAFVDKVASTSGYADTVRLFYATAPAGYKTANTTYQFLADSVTTLNTTVYGFYQKGTNAINQFDGQTTMHFSSMSGSPTISDIPNGYFRMIKNTSNGELRLYANDSGNIKSVLLN